MKLSNGNPCKECPNKGCGRHSECETYLAYFQKNRQIGEKKINTIILSEYTVESILKAKHGGAHRLGKKYRPRGRW